LPATYLVFDAPLGRAHHATGALIDFMVYLNTPLDVAMARRLLRDLAQAAPSHPAQHLAQIRIELATYLDFGRVAYLEMEQQIRPKCDLILDGLSPPDMLARQIVDQVKSQYEQLPTTDN
jgi:uridine kinase